MTLPHLDQKSEFIVIPTIYSRLIHKPSSTYAENIKNIRSTNYLVSAKADGERSGLFLSRGKAYYLSFRDGVKGYLVGKTDISETLIFDGELMTRNVKNEPVTPYLLLFDFLNSEENSLSMRIDKTFDIIKKVFVESVLGDIRVKTYQSLKKAHSILGSFLEPKRDGLIFSPKYGPPGKNVIKFKTIVTMDLTIKKEISKNHHIARFGEPIYHVYGFDPRSKRLVPVSLQLGPIEMNLSSKFEIYRNLLNVMGEPVDDYDGKIVEVTVADKELTSHFGKFVGDCKLVRVRDDKMRPSNVEYIKDVMQRKVITNLDLVLGFGNYKFVKNTFGTDMFQKWVSYQRTIKNSIYSRFCAGHVLDIGCGDGNDFFSLSQIPTVRQLTVVEKNPLAMANCSTVLDLVEFGKAHFPIKKICADGLSLKTWDLVEDNSIDTIIFSYSWHHFQDPLYNQHDNNIRKILQKLKIGGNLIIFYLDVDSLEKKKSTTCDECMIEFDLEMFNSLHNPNFVFKREPTSFYHDPHPETKFIWMNPQGEHSDKGLGLIREPAVSHGKIKEQIENFQSVLHNSYCSLKDPLDDSLSVLAGRYACSIFRKTFTVNKRLNIVDRLPDDVWTHGIFPFLPKASQNSLRKVSLFFAQKLSSELFIIDRQLCHEFS